MFGTKATDLNTRPQRFEYLADDFVGKGAFNKGVNALAQSGWEVVSASFNGAAYHVCLKREVGPQ